MLQLSRSVGSYCFSLCDLFFITGFSFLSLYRTECACLWKLIFISMISLATIQLQSATLPGGNGLRHNIAHPQYSPTKTLVQHLNVIQHIVRDLKFDISYFEAIFTDCRQSTNHSLSQCWPRSMSPYGITRPQRVNLSLHIISPHGNGAEVVIVEILPHRRQCPPCLV